MIDADGFIRYQHFGEGAYDENEEEIQELLTERNEIFATHLTYEVRCTSMAGCSASGLSPLRLLLEDRLGIFE